MTAEENVMVAMHSHMKSGILEHGAAHAPAASRGAGGRASSRASCSTSSGIGKVADEYARNLSYGDQRRLEVARALALRPKVLLLDEPTAGMNPQESAQFVEFVHEVRDEMEVSVLLIEHDMSVVMRVSERITVLDRARRSPRALPDEIKTNERVVEAYLGKTGTDGYGERRKDGPETSAGPAGSERPGAGEPLLSIQDLHVYYGNIAAVKGLYLEVTPARSSR